MGRDRTDFGPAVDQQIREFMARGGTAQSISDALSSIGVKGASNRTIARRMQEFKAGVRAERSGMRTDDPLPATPDAVPEGAAESDYDSWLADAKAHADAAQAEGDLEGFGKMGRLTVALLEAKRKATPLPKEDINAHPDMLAAKERARAALHRLVDQAVGE